MRYLILPTSLVKPTFSKVYMSSTNQWVVRVSPSTEPSVVLRPLFFLIEGRNSWWEKTQPLLTKIHLEGLEYRCAILSLLGGSNIGREGRLMGFIHLNNSDCVHEKRAIAKHVCDIIPLSLQTQPSPGTALWIRSADTAPTCCSYHPQKPGRSGPCCLWSVPCRPSLSADKQRSTGMVMRHHRQWLLRTDWADIEPLCSAEVHLEIWPHFSLSFISLAVSLTVALNASPAPVIYANINANTASSYCTIHGFIIQT